MLVRNELFIPTTLVSSLDKTSQACMHLKAFSNQCDRFFFYLFIYVHIYIEHTDTLALNICIYNLCFLPTLITRLVRTAQNERVDGDET